MKNKKGLSAVLETVIFIALAVAVVGMIWAVVNGLVSRNISETEACFGIFNKVTLNPRYTCYDSVTKDLQFSIDVQDVIVDDVLVSVVSQGESVQFQIINNSEVAYLNGTTPASPPGENQGRTYVYQVPGSFLFGIDSLRITPIISGKTCDAPDTITEIDSCSELVG